MRALSRALRGANDFELSGCILREASYEQGVVGFFLRPAFWAGSVYYKIPVRLTLGIIHLYILMSHVHTYNVRE